MAKIAIDRKTGTMGRQNVPLVLCGLTCFSELFFACIFLCWGQIRESMGLQVQRTE